MNIITSCIKCLHNGVYNASFLNQGQRQNIACFRSAVVKIFHIYLDVQIFTDFQQFLEFILIVNVYVMLYWFFIQTFYAVFKEATIKKFVLKRVLSKSRQSIVEIVVNDELHFLVDLQDERLQLYWKWYTVLLYRYFTGIFKHF